MSKSKVAVITGAARGLGAAFARYAAENDYKTILIDKDEAGLASVESSLAGVGQEVRCVRADLSSEPDVGRIEALLLEGEPVDLLINNAGFGYFVNYFFSC